MTQKYESFGSRKILIDNSIFEDEIKERMKEKVDGMEEGEIIELGRSLATQRQQEITSSQQAIVALDEFIQSK